MRWILPLHNNHISILYQQVLQLSLTKEKGVGKIHSLKLLKIGSSLKEYCSSVNEYFIANKNQEQPQPSGEEIHAMISKVFGLMRLEIFKIVEKLH